jgi:hypothetical protein
LVNADAIVKPVQPALKGRKDAIKIGSFVNKVHQSLYLIGTYGNKRKASVTTKTRMLLVLQPYRYQGVTDASTGYQQQDQKTETTWHTV